MATGLARAVHGPSAAWPSALSALAASSASGWEADSAGSLSTTAGRTFATPSGAPTACRWIFVISAPDSVVGIAIARAAPQRRRGERLGGVDHPPAAERDDAVALDLAEQLAGQLVDAARADLVHRAGGSRPPPAAIRHRARRGQQRVAGPAEGADRLLGDAAAEADEALAVLPGEAHGRGDITPRGRGPSAWRTGLSSSYQDSA